MRQDGSIAAADFGASRILMTSERTKSFTGMTRGAVLSMPFQSCSPLESTCSPI